MDKSVKKVKIGNIGKNGSHLVKGVTGSQISQTRGNGQHSEKWVTLGKMDHSGKNQSKKRARLEKMGHP